MLQLPGKRGVSSRAADPGALNALRRLLALILEHLWWSIDPITAEVPPAQIGKEAIQAAIHLIDDYFAPMTVRCYGDARHHQHDASVLALAQAILVRSPETVNARDVYSTWGIASIGSSVAFEAASAALEAADWLRPVNSDSGAKGGRPRKDYAINPNLSQNPQN